MKKPINIVETGDYVEPGCFDSERELLLFFSYIEAHEYIKYQPSMIDGLSYRIGDLWSEIAALREKVKELENNLKN